MKQYYRLMLGQGSIHAPVCFAENFIGVDLGIDQNLTGQLPEQWQQFNKAFIPIYLAKHPDKTKIGAGLACGGLWTFAKGINKGDVLLCPDGTGFYRVAEVEGDYYYTSGDILPHRRKVKWLPTTIAKEAMSEALKNSAGSIGTISSLASHANELEAFISEGKGLLSIIASDPVVEDLFAFAMEKHLESFLIANWQQTELANDFAIFEEDGELKGQQYNTDAGIIDVLAVSKDGKRLLVVELKRGRATDVVVGQILRYMGYVKEQIAESDQIVEGVIIALEDDPKLRWALISVPAISFYRYLISFKLVKG